MIGPAPSGSPTGARIAPLTGLRAVAAFAVCVTHAAFWAGDFTPDAAGAAYARLETAVPVFFALSGFLLVRPWIRRAPGGGPPHQLGGGPPDLRRYWVRRFWRVLPAYWITVTAVYLIYLVRADPSDSGGGWDGYLRHLLLLQIYGPDHVHTGLTQTWSLSVEVAFYLLLPLFGAGLVWCAHRGVPEAMVPAALVLVSLGWVAWVCATDAFGKTSRSWPPAYLACFGLGMAVALLAGRVRWTRWHSAGCVLGAVAAFGVLLTPAAGPIDLAQPSAVQGVTKMGLEALIGGLAVAVCALGPGTSVGSRVLGSRALVWLGGISYEFFLLHVMVLDFVVVDLLDWPLFHGSTWVIVAVTTVITLPVALGLRAVVDRLNRAASPRGPRSTRRGGRRERPTGFR